MKNLVNRFVREEEGQDLIEYSLLAALIAVACIVAMKALAVDINGSSPRSGLLSPRRKWTGHETRRGERPGAFQIARLTVERVQRRARRAVQESL